MHDVFEQVKERIARLEEINADLTEGVPSETEISRRIEVRIEELRWVLDLLTP